MSEVAESPTKMNNLNPTLSAAWIGAGVYETDHGATGELIRYRNGLCRVARNDDGTYVIKPHTISSLFILLESVGMPYVRAMLDTPDTVEVPVVRELVTKPVYGLDGELIEESGYLPEVEVWYQPIDVNEMNVYSIVREGDVYQLIEVTLE